MSDNILDIAKWEQDYPFLYTVWHTYNDFDKPVEGNKYTYEAVCDPFMKSYGDGNDVYKSFCMKLVRNLGFYATGTEFFNPTFERCNILYSWLYNKSNNPKIPDSIISESFADYIYQMEQTVKNHKCSYDLYNNTYVEQMKINILNIFYDNMNIIKGILKGQDGSQKNSCLKFVCKCVKIYDLMHQRYCLKRELGNEKHRNTCSRLEKFKDTYIWFFQNEQDLKDKIPALDNIKNTYMSKCQKYVQEEREQLVGGEERHALSPLTRFEDKKTDEHTSLEAPEDENQGSLMSPTVSTALSTVAGASSFLALLYKFSPAKKWIHSGLGGSRGRIHSNFNVDRERELLFDGLAHDNLNSYNIGYEAAYGS
ncbi:unnamed protein product [Plasmodium vivax]|uniref:(malaria parasite P. vivax) hypothetical protein n=1 Tax=Plasmodium vivax TaxID=5855 RepID=A0A8S4HAK6_PLAVI|nr:unnamed protein product [Plasmodium vivax]